MAVHRAGPVKTLSPQGQMVMEACHPLVTVMGASLEGEVALPLVGP